MLWALTKPVPDDRTDLGVIAPEIVCTNVILVSLESTSLCAEVVMAQSESTIGIIKNLLRMT